MKKDQKPDETQPVIGFVFTALKIPDVGWKLISSHWRRGQSADRAYQDVYRALTGGELLDTVDAIMGVNYRLGDDHSPSPRELDQDELPF